MVEFVALLAFKVAGFLIFDSRSLFGQSAPHLQYSPFSAIVLGAFVQTLPRLYFGQVPLSILMHFFVLRRPDGYAKSLKCSILVNAGTCLLFCVVIFALFPTTRQFFDIVSDDIRVGAIGWITLVASVISPYVAMRMWSSALLTKGRAEEPDPSL